MTRMLYRPYIDGLRAISVIAVILFHFGWSGLAGGFVGVDIFFVISGFLITQLLAEPSTLSTSKQLAQFYVRRMRRILPALLGTSFIVAAAALFLYLPDDLARLCRYLVYVPLMLSNLANWQDGGYFATAGNYFVPLRHYWSLAVEEQFYIAYPLAFLFLVRARPRLLLAGLTTIAGASMILCIVGASRHSAVLFYLMPARAWELMLGAVAARYPVTWFDSRLLTECVVFACLAIVLLAFYVLGEATGFPHPYAAIPCSATALLLFISRRRKTLATRLLSLRPLVFTGRISYSLYLWHAPILVFAQYFVIRKLSLGALGAVALAIYGVAVLSWLFLENPIRRKALLQSDRALVIAALSGCLVVGAMGAWFWMGRGLPWIFSRDIQVLTQLAPVPQEAIPCTTLSSRSVASGDLCRFGPDNVAVHKVVLWGDSHALALFPAVRALVQAQGMQLDFASRSSCRPLLGALPGAPGPQGLDPCASFNTAMLSAVRHIHPEVTILSAFWDLDSSRRTAMEPILESTVTAIRATGSPVCIVLDVPEVPYVEPYALAMARRRDLDTGFLYVMRSDIAARYSGFENTVRALAARQELRVVDPKDVLCSGARCDLEYAGRSLYRDANHLTAVGAMRVAPAITSCLPQRP
jgi:peptidoglycan/LPS O-acetylase OafA/YrhL